MRNFLIMSLPRSRTAWLSNFLTVGKCYCYHDLWYHSGCDAAAFGESMRHPEVLADSSGTADSGAIFALDEIRKELPDLVEIYVRRDLSECISSMALAMDEPEDAIRPFMIDCHEALEDRCFEHQFKFEQLDDETTVRDLWEVVTGGLPFPMAHFEKSVRQQIMLKPGYLIDVKNEAMENKS